MTTFNWLHLTDLHFGHREQDHLWSDSREMFFDDLKKMHDRCGPFNAVLFTGDLVYSGEIKQFERFEKEVLTRLFKKLNDLGSTDAVLLAVPGNHDLKRYSKTTPEVRVITGNDFENDPDGFWDASKKNKYRNSVEFALKNYHNWWGNTSYRGSQIINPGIFTGDFSTTLQAGDFKIGVIGLNSTTRQLVVGDFEGKLLLHAKQLAAVCGDTSDWFNKHDVNLLLTHQGPTWLSKDCLDNEYEPSIYPSGRFAAHLFGHLHENDLSENARGGSETRRYFQGASWFGLESYGEPPGLDRKHGYAMGCFKFADGEIKLRWWPRIGTKGANNTYRFKRDDQFELDENDGGTEPTIVGSYQQEFSITPPLDTTIENPAKKDNLLPLDVGDTSYESSLNPYKNLEYYDIDEADKFVGRDKYTELVVEALIEGFDKSDKSPIVRISGSSGTGKSSLLRAGVLAKLKKEHSNYYIVVFRPTDFHNKLGVPEDIIKKILVFIDSQTDLTISSSKAEKVADDVHPVDKAITFIEHMLKPKSGEKGVCLVIGLDQFEEVVDDLSTNQLAKLWIDLKEFINKAIQSKQIGLVLTLETSREQNFKRCGLDDKIVKSTNVLLDGFNYEFLIDVINLPFRKAGYPLSNEVVDKLLDNATELKTSRRDTNKSSLLPLLALKLYHLFEKVMVFKGSPNDRSTSSIQQSFGNADNEGITISELKKNDENLEIGGEIEWLAMAAWLRATDSKEVDQEQLDYFLKPLVRLAESYSDNLVLCTMCLPPYRDERKLAEAFKAFRLLVPIDNDKDEPRLRLVHEAIIRHWPAAKIWLNNRKAFLKTEALFRRKCDNWFSNNKPADMGFSSAEEQEKEIDNAAEILSTYVRTWSFGNSNRLDKLDRKLFDYCLGVFNLSNTPRKPVPHSKNNSLHIHLAAFYGQLELLEKFKQLESKCLDLPRQDGKTPLHCASWTQFDAVRFLLKSGCQATQPDNDGWHPIAAAIQMERRDIFNLLLPYLDDDSFFISKTKGYMLLHLCAEFGQLEMAKVFIENGKILPDCADENGWLPLHYAAFEGHLAVFEYLAVRSDITAVIKTGWTALHLAAQEDHNNIVTALLKNPDFRGFEGACIEGGYTALMIAASHHSALVIPSLLAVSDPNLTFSDTGSTPLHLAIENCSSQTNDQQCLDTIKQLLSDHRTNPNIKNAKGITPIALAKDKPKILRVLIQNARIDPDLPCSETEGDTPLILSAKAKLWDDYQLLLKRSKCNRLLPLDDKNNSLLHILIESDAPVQLIQELLNMPNIDVNALNQKGFTPLMSAIAKAGEARWEGKEARWDVVDLMLNCGYVDRNVHGDNSQSPLALALAAQAEEPIINALWNSSCDELKTGDENGLTPLHIAALRNDLPQIQWIESHCPSFKKLAKVKDKRGRRPIDIASPLALAYLSRIAEQTTDKVQATPKSWDSGLQWIGLPAEKREELVARIEPVDGKYKLTDQTSIQTAELSFYKSGEVHILRLTDTTWSSGLQLFYLENAKSKLFRLNGTSTPIHEVNASNIQLNRENVLDYLRFFCFFVRSIKGGPFLVIESITQYEVPDDMNAEEQEKIDRLVMPATLFESNDENIGFLASSYIWYFNAIYFANFRIDKSGMIEMENDLPLLPGLTKTINVPIA